MPPRTCATTTTPRPLVNYFSLSLAITRGSKTFKAKALSRIKAGTANKAIGDEGVYVMVSSTDALPPTSASRMMKSIRQSLAIPLKPFSETTLNAPSDSPFFLNLQRTRGGNNGGKPNTSSTFAPTVSGNEGVGVSTATEEATIFGQFSVVARKRCSSVALTEEITLLVFREIA